MAEPLRSAQHLLISGLAAVVWCVEQGVLGITLAALQRWFELVLVLAPDRFGDLSRSRSPSRVDPSTGRAHAVTRRLVSPCPADRHAGELHLDRLGVSTAVDLVVAHERRGINVDTQRVVAVCADVPVAGVVIHHPVPEQRRSIRAEVPAVGIDERGLHVDIGTQRPSPEPAP